MRLKFLSESIKEEFPSQGQFVWGMGVEEAVGQEQKIGGDQNTEPGIRSMLTGNLGSGV